MLINRNKHLIIAYESEANKINDFLSIPQNKGVEWNVQYINKDIDQIKYIQENH